MPAAKTCNAGAMWYYSLRAAAHAMEPFCEKENWYAPLDVPGGYFSYFVWPFQFAVQKYCDSFLDFRW